jgi:hypothetical protein
LQSSRGHDWFLELPLTLTLLAQGHVAAVAWWAVGVVISRPSLLSVAKTEPSMPMPTQVDLVAQYHR